MPGKKTQEWTDDAAFWNEAWGDMEQRLDSREPQRKGVVWTRWIVLLALLLAGVVAASLINGIDLPDPAAREVSVPVIEQHGPIPPDGAKPPVVVGSPAAVRADGEAPFNSIPAPEAAEQTGQDTGQEVPGRALPSNVSPEGLVSLSDNLPPDVPQAADFSVKESLVVAAPDVVHQEVTPGTISTDIERAQVPEVIAPLAQHPPTLSYSVPLPKATISRQRGTSLPLFIEAGGNIALGRTTPGFLVGVGTQLVRSGRFSIPLSLRYRKDLMRLGEGRNGRTEALEIVGMPSADLAESPIEALRVVSGTQATALTTTGLEVVSGLRYQVSRKLRVGVTLGGEYLLRADGLIDAVQEGDQISYTFNNRIEADLGLTGAFNNVSASNLSFSGVSGSSGINRFRLRTGFQVDYQVAPRLAVTVGVSRVTTPIYRSDLLQVRPTQFQAGISYRLR